MFSGFLLQKSEDFEKSCFAVLFKKNGKKLSSENHGVF